MSNNNNSDEVTLLRQQLQASEQKIRSLEDALAAKSKTSQASPSSTSSGSWFFSFGSSDAEQERDFLKKRVVELQSEVTWLNQVHLTQLEDQRKLTLELQEARAALAALSSSSSTESATNVPSAGIASASTPSSLSSSNNNAAAAVAGISSASPTSSGASSASAGAPPVAWSEVLELRSELSAAKQELRLQADELLRKQEALEHAANELAELKIDDEDVWHISEKTAAAAAAAEAAVSGTFQKKRPPSISTPLRRVLAGGGGGAGGGLSNLGGANGARGVFGSGSETPSAVRRFKEELMAAKEELRIQAKELDLKQRALEEITAELATVKSQVLPTVTEGEDANNNNNAESSADQPSQTGRRRPPRLGEGNLAPPRAPPVTPIFHAELKQKDLEIWRKDQELSSLRQVLSAASDELRVQTEELERKQSALETMTAELNGQQEFWAQQIHMQVQQQQQQQPGEAESGNLSLSNSSASSPSQLQQHQQQQIYQQQQQQQYQQQQQQQQLSPNSKRRPPPLGDRSAILLTKRSSSFSEEMAVAVGLGNARSEVLEKMKSEIVRREREVLELKTELRLARDELRVQAEELDRKQTALEDATVELTQMATELAHLDKPEESVEDALMDLEDSSSSSPPSAAGAEGNDSSSSAPAGGGDEKRRPPPLKHAKSWKDLAVAHNVSSPSGYSPSALRAWKEQVVDKMRSKLNSARDELRMQAAELNRKQSALEHTTAALTEMSKELGPLTVSVEDQFGELFGEGAEKVEEKDENDGGKRRPPALKHAKSWHWLIDPAGSTSSLSPAQRQSIRRLKMELAVAREELREQNQELLRKQVALEDVTAELVIIRRGSFNLGSSPIMEGSVSLFGGVGERHSLGSNEEGKGRRPPRLNHSMSWREPRASDNLPTSAVNRLREELAYAPNHLRLEVAEMGPRAVRFASTPKSPEENENNNVEGAQEEEEDVQALARRAAMGFSSGEPLQQQQQQQQQQGDRRPPAIAGVVRDVAPSSVVPPPPSVAAPPVPSQQAAPAANGEIAGVGVMWDRFLEIRSASVSALLDDGAAAQSGRVFIGDKLIAVDYLKVEDIFDKLADAIRGPSGTPVILTLQHSSGDIEDVKLFRKATTLSPTAGSYPSAAPTSARQPYPVSSVASSGPSLSSTLPSSYSFTSAPQPLFPYSGGVGGGGRPVSSGFPSGIIPTTSSSLRSPSLQYGGGAGLGIAPSPSSSSYGSIGSVGIGSSTSAISPSAGRNLTGLSGSDRLHRSFDTYSDPYSRRM